MSQLITAIRPARHREVVVLKRPRVHPVHVLIKCTTQGDVDGLNPATNPEDRFSVRDGPAEQLELDAIALGIGCLAKFMAILPVVRGADVAAACEKKALKLVEDAAQSQFVVYQ